jgi:hypothetical protein
MVSRHGPDEVVSQATADDELLALRRGLQKAKERAARNGMRLEVSDVDAGAAWPRKRWLGVHLMDGSKQVAGVAMTYHDDASKGRALSICCERVYSRPDRVD